MECKTFRGIVESRLKNGVVNEALTGEAARHLQNCALCRDKYAPFLDSDNDNRPKIAPEPAELKKSNPLDDDPADQFPDIADPVEFKDTPITFMLILDDRQEEIKVVEPEVDLPIPEGARLAVRENDVCLTDVSFKFNPASDRPYELHFSTLKGIRYAADHVKAFGTEKAADKDLRRAYSMAIIDRGGLHATIEMTRGKARIHIQYRPQRSA